MIVGETVQFGFSNQGLCCLIFFCYLSEIFSAGLVCWCVKVSNPNYMTNCNSMYLCVYPFLYVLTCLYYTERSICNANKSFQIVFNWCFISYSIWVNLTGLIMCLGMYLILIRFVIYWYWYPPILVGIAQNFRESDISVIP